MQLRNEKSELEGTLAREQEHQMEKLLKRIDRLQNEVSSKQETLDQVIVSWSALFDCMVISDVNETGVSIFFLIPGKEFLDFRESRLVTARQ